MPKIPPRNTDLRRYVLRNDLRRAVLYCFWVIVWYGGAAAYNANHQTYPPDRLMTGWKIVIWMLMSVLSGFLLFRIGRFFTDRTVEGEIVSSGLSRTYTASDDPGMLKSADYDFRLNTNLKIRKKDGRIKRLRFEQKRGFYLYYYEKTHIVRLHGLPYPVNTDPLAPRGYLCAACGKINDNCSRPCEACGHSIIDPNELREL